MRVKFNLEVVAVFGEDGEVSVTIGGGQIHDGGIWTWWGDPTIADSGSEHCDCIGMGGAVASHIDHYLRIAFEEKYGEDEARYAKEVLEQ